MDRERTEMIEKASRMMIEHKIWSTTGETYQGNVSADECACTPVPLIGRGVSLTFRVLWACDRVHPLL